MTGSSGTFRYEVRSSCPVDVTYTSDGMNTEQVSKVQDGWLATATDPTVAQVIAQLSCTGGAVTANIYQNGNLVKTATSSGDYTIAHAVYP